MTARGAFTDLASRISAIRPRDVPPSLHEEAKLAVLDTFAVALAGQRSPAAQGVRRTARRTSGTGRASVWWTRHTLAIDAAAFMNAFASHVLDFDSVHYSTFGHSATVILPALFPFFDDPFLSGREILNAYIVGVEVMGVLGNAFGERLRERGHHPTAVLGTLAASSAVGWLLRLDEVGMARALCLSGVSLGGYTSSFGSSAKAYQVAAAARDGLSAAVYARDGNVSVPRGAPWLDNLCRLSGADLDRLADDTLCKPWILDQVPTAFKQYPCCAYFHQTLDALVSMLEEGRVRAPDVRAVKLVLPSYVVGANRFSRPRTVDEGRFSLAYNAALAICFGRVGPEHFQSHLLEDSLVQNVMASITTRESEAPRSLVEIVVTLKNDSELRVTFAHRLPDRAQRSALEKKFLGLAEGSLVEADCHAFLALLRAFEGARASDLAPFLTVEMEELA
ncbi:MmgE/PrpD family protein [Pendulispora albinea]|uniref:MmgE/PrpD family protein n=1 Tax=Pendulispora albinea TaxID=2741071 RepID=A0ABZ2M3B9_9BACT